MINLKSYPDDLLFLLRDSIKEEINARRKAGAILKRKTFIQALSPKNFDTESEFNKAVHARNASQLFSLPHQDAEPIHRVKYLPSLIAQDWSHLFQSYSDDSKEFYVYAHVAPHERIFVAREEVGGNYKGNPFYIGKGKGNRAWCMKRNQGHGKKLRDTLSRGFSPEDVVKIVFDGLSERKAMELESKLVYFFGTIYERDKGSSLYNLDTCVRPEFVGEMQALEKTYRSIPDYKKSRRI